MSQPNSQLAPAIFEYGLEKHVLELETDGLTIVPPEVTGITQAMVDSCVEVVLARFTQMTGCPISLENGPEAELCWPDEVSAGTGLNPTQLQFMQLLKLDRCFRDLCVNPVADTLVNHLIGRNADAGAQGAMPRNRRLSSTIGFLKWEGLAYGETLGLHCDQRPVPLPWGPTALIANATWCLTDYTKARGALAYVPGSHKSNAHPGPQAYEQAVPAECPKGSVIIWPGSTWHGAYPKTTPGLRLNAVAYYRHHSVLPQENLRVTMQDQPWEDCGDPEMMRELIGFDDMFPYTEEFVPVPRVSSAD